MRLTLASRASKAVAAPAAMLITGLLAAVPVVPAAPAAGEPPPTCDDPFCTPGIQPGAILGQLCENTSYYVFGTMPYGPVESQPGRLLFCSSPRRIHARWFRSPMMVGVKDEGADCNEYLNMVAQAPDGLFLTCIAQNGHTYWVRGDT